MKADIKRAWIDDLRSGWYPQTIGALHRITEINGYPAGYCCLGRLCEVAIQMGAPIDKDVQVFSESECEGYAMNGEPHTAGIPPHNIMLWCDLTVDLDGEIYVDDEMTSQLASLNDNGYTFPEIADWIESNL